jgi:hypothetical protein
MHTVWTTANEHTGTADHNHSCWTVGHQRTSLLCQPQRLANRGTATVAVGQFFAATYPVYLQMKPSTWI